MRRVAAAALGAVLLAVGLGAQSPADVRRAVDRLGDFDFAVRLEASRWLRRADAAVAVPILLEAGRGHDDSYVQFRALVLAYGFGPPQLGAVFRDVLDSENDRARAVAYEYFEQFPSPAVVPRLLAALETETSEFVRPYLVRALAANDDTAEVRRRLVLDIDRGEGYFRGAVIEALGDYQAPYAVERLIRVARSDGPLQDDALLALGKIGDARAVPVLRAIQAEADERLQPTVSATACLLGIECADQVAYVVDTLAYAAATGGEGEQARLRAAATGLAALAITGNRPALAALFEHGVTTNESARAPIAIALGTVALRSPAVVRDALYDRAATAQPEAELLLMRDAFDLLDEDFAEERFYVLMRGDYWGAPEGGSDRTVAETAIQILEF